MGYTTDFEGSFKLDKPLSLIHNAYLTAFAESRRMKRDVTKIPLITIDVSDFAEGDVIAKLEDAPKENLHVLAGLPLGNEGGYFVGGEDISILDYNREPQGQPGLWCQWVPNEDGTEIEWDGGEKFYNYVEWLEYIIDNFLKPWGYKLNGAVKWFGEEPEDLGCIVVNDNVVKSKVARISYVD